ncbi:hypothetical protein O9G_000169 [Rozella allomycis CSF55]|uniref:BRCT domain-containing protein n=1 Tax=Rozella allomycis (strain CSF55) TaxID=988480 RepID=A0A075ANY1_ROZAC|nr:hypothetical protein O9G_000169 [Rozella allomycis CSF55]|eukprot:EPZ31690.1 hypothetical protein O9G_000169 [Rozella allomycis CSF55]
MRTEKFLSACAVGAWILHPDYFSACQSQNAFVDEEKYEWSAIWSPKISSLVNAPKYCRLMNKSRKVYENWNVLLLIDEKRLGGFKRLIELGGGYVSTSEDSSSFTHVITDTNSASALRIDAFKSRYPNAVIAKTDYISEFLINGDSFDPSYFIL